tara:strand:+ start:11947 stop:12306 length:360 start_codon:yes stop_codon:yes gene_type:complete
MFILNHKKFKLKMIDLFPKKSLFGFKILGAWHSTIAAYLMLIPLFKIPPFFGTKVHEIKSGYIFLIIINLSIIILTINSIQQKKRNNLYLWFITNLPLWLLIPLEFKILLSSFRALLLI